MGSAGKKLVHCIGVIAGYSACVFFAITLGLLIAVIIASALESVWLDTVGNPLVEIPDHLEWSWPFFVSLVITLVTSFLC